MRNAILLHGTPDEKEYYSDKYPSSSNSHWFPWLQKQLQMKDVSTQTPEVPDAHKPEYEKWKREFERFEVGENTILVGHSCGGGFLLRWLSENKKKGNKLVLVAPWLDPEKRKTTDFFDFKIDPKLNNRFNEIHLFVSSDDNREILESVEIITKQLPDIKIHEFADKGYFCCENLKTDEFPELLNAILE